MRVVCSVLMVVAACSNPCEDMCMRMADYAEECGFSVPEAEIDACVESQNRVDRDEARICRDHGSLEQIRDEWSCEELEPYFHEGPTL